MVDLIHKRLGYVTDEERRNLATRFEHEFCITRKLFCPSSYELADAYMLVQQGPTTRTQISTIVGVPSTKADEIVDALMKQGYVKEENGLVSKV